MSWDERKVRLRERLKKLRPRESWFTRDEKNIRDKLLNKVTGLLYLLEINANRMTLFGTLLIICWIILYEILHIRSLWPQIAFIAAIGLTDAIDGPLARNHDDVTLEGTLGDYARDLCYLLYMCRVAYGFGLPLYMTAAIVSFEVLALGIKAWMFLCFCERGFSLEKAMEFAETNFQNEFEDRIQFFTVCFGVPLVMLGIHHANETFYNIGLALVWISIGMGIFVLRKEWQWSPLE